MTQYKLSLVLFLPHYTSLDHLINWALTKMHLSKNKLDHVFCIEIKEFSVWMGWAHLLNMRSLHSARAIVVCSYVYCNNIKLLQCDPVKALVQYADKAVILPLLACIYRIHWSCGSFLLNFMKFRSFQAEWLCLHNCLGPLEVKACCLISAVPTEWGELDPFSTPPVW